MAQEVLTGNEGIEELQKLYDVFTNRIRLIDEKKANTKPEIYQKVRNEYEAKLLEVQVLLEEKGAGLEDALNQALAEKDQILPQLQQVSNTLEELELRMVIGEVTEEEKAAQEQALLAQKTEMENNAAALNQKIEKLNTFVKGKTTQSAPIPPAPPVKFAASAPVPPKPVVPPAAPVHPAPKPPVPPAPRPAPVAVPPPVAKPVPPAPPVMPAPPEPVPPAPAPAPELSEVLQPPVNEMDELEKQFASILGSSFSEAPAQPAPAMEEVMPRPQPTPTFEVPPAMQAPEVPVTAAVPETSAEEESHKGELKCPKCAAYNRADNWYCEKCGNELLNAQDLFGGGK
ncbi:hypothetical protein HY768_00400 [candidate division TA06 bacterium]|uniref:RanBP2-type domain-containing protein n=1 Tax=candidate division TA06 bacterium TaxID=2250710 RepID=A0A933I993_UNCT6|nr:hypothetical protein [candidate division TA06 bacterium]